MTNVFANFRIYQRTQNNKNCNSHKNLIGNLVSTSYLGQLRLNILFSEGTIEGTMQIRSVGEKASWAD